MSTLTVIEVNRNDYAQTRIVESDVPQIGDGEVLLKVDQMGMTANNVSYAVAGDMLRYWDLFPAEEGWGRVPFWSFQTVAASNHPEIKVGDRFYGVAPLGSHHVVRPVAVKPTGFMEDSSHRKDLAAAYNQYQNIATNKIFDHSYPERHLTLAPLFTTGFLLDDYVAHNKGFGAQTIILTSASSKTSLALAYLLSKRDGFKVVGLTSPGNKSFVEGTGFYDSVVLYDDIGSLDASIPAMVVDMAGNAQVTANIHNHYGDKLTADTSVGATHKDLTTIQGAGDTLPGPKPEFFFAPSQFTSVIERLGQTGFSDQVASTLKEFMIDSEKWMQIDARSGAKETQDVWDDLMANRASPATGYVATIG